MPSVTLSNELLEPAMSYAASCALPLDLAVAKLIRLSLERACVQQDPAASNDFAITAFEMVDDFGQFLLPADAPRLSTEELLGLEDDH